MDKVEKTQLLLSSGVSVKTGLFEVKFLFYKLLIFSLVLYFVNVTVQNFYLSREAIECRELCKTNLENGHSSLKNGTKTHKNQNQSQIQSQSQKKNQTIDHDSDTKDTATLFDFLLPKKPWLNVDLQMRYLINNDVCSSFPAKNKANNPDEILIINLVQSGTMNQKNRDAIRSSMTKEELKRLGVRRIFLLARPQPQSNPKHTLLSTKKTKNTVQIKDLILENEEHGDLLIGDFLDTYKNLTYKTLMGLDWATKFCPQAKFIVKNDDDILVDFYQLSLLLSNALPSSSDFPPFRLQKKLHMGSNDPALQFVSNIKSKLSPSSPDQRFIMGSFLNRVIERSPSSKFYVSFDEFPQENWPMYSCGMGYVTTIETAMDLVKESKITKFFWIEDVHVTGFLRKKRNIEFISMDTLTTYYTNELHCCIPKYLDSTSKLDIQLDLDILNNSNNNNNNSLTNNISDFLQPRWCHHFFGQIDSKHFSIFSNYMTHAKFCYDSNLCKRWEKLEDQLVKCDAVKKQT